MRAAGQMTIFDLMAARDPVAEAAAAVDAAGVCSKMPFSRTPPEKKCGCLYFERREARDARR